MAWIKKWGSWLLAGVVGLLLLLARLGGMRRGRKKEQIEQLQGEIEDAEAGAEAAEARAEEARSDQADAEKTREEHEAQRAEEVADREQNEKDDPTAAGSRRRMDDVLGRR